MTLDPVTMQLVGHKLEAIADEMMYTLVRTSRSTAAVLEHDCSAALLDGRGRLLAQGQASAGHMGAMRVVVPEIEARFGKRVYPGDVFIVNSPENGGMHLPDIFAMKPIFAAKRIVAYAGAMVHHLDIGGRTPGSVAADARSIFEEGLSIPMVKLRERGKINQTVVDFIRANVRMPDTVLGDLNGQIASCSIGERGILELVETYGVELLTQYIEALFAYAERLTRSVIATWPDGTYEFSDYLDDDGIGPDPVRFHARVTIQGDQVIIDYTGTADQVEGAFNGSLGHTIACAMIPVRYALRADVPSNDGYFRPVTVVMPEGAIGNPRHPAARGARGATGRRLEEVVLGALRQAVPDRLPACPAGDVDMLRFGRVLPDGRSEVVSDNVWGVPGARPDSDGPDGLATSGRAIANVPAEILERSFPVRVLRYEYKPDSGGPGTYRGGLAIEREWEIVAPGIRLTIRSDRRRFPPWGAAGGLAGAPSGSILVSRGETQILPSKVNRTVQQGDRLVHHTAGGGGYGPPLQRDPEAVLRDYLEGKVSIAGAREHYGVAIDEASRTVDAVATQRLRASRARPSADAG